MKKILASAIAISAISTLLGQVHIAPSSATWSLVTTTPPESDSIHTFVAGTSDGTRSASGYTNRTSAKGGGFVSFDKLDHFSGKLTFKVKWYGSSPGTGQSATIKVKRAVEIWGYISASPVPNQAKWIRSQWSGGFWDVTCPWSLSAAASNNMAQSVYTHPDNNTTKDLLDLTTTASFESTPQADGGYVGTIEVWPYWDHVTQALVEGPANFTHQKTNVSYSLEIYKVGGIVVDGFSGSSSGSSGGSGTPPRPGSGELLATLLSAGRSKQSEG